MTFIIRRAIHGDAESIISVHEKSIREICFKDYTPEQIEAWASRPQKVHLWRQAIERDLIWVVEYQNSIHGFAHLAHMNESMAEVMGLYLSPSMTGKKAGRALMEVMIDEAKNQKKMVLELHSTLTAKKFYLKFGFIETDGMLSVEMQGVKIPCIPMKLDL